MTPNPFASFKTCVTCVHLQQTVRVSQDKPEYTCGRTGTSAHDERRGDGICGREGVQWEAR